MGEGRKVRTVDMIVVDKEYFEFDSRDRGPWPVFVFVCDQTDGPRG